MTNENNLTTLFRVYSEQDNPPIIELLNHEKKTVGALYLKTLRQEDMIITTLNNIEEKYYLYVNGVGIYFTFYRKK